MKKYFLVLIVLALAVASSFAQDEPDLVWHVNYIPETTLETRFFNHETIVVLTEAGVLFFYDVQTGEKLAKTANFHPIFRDVTSFDLHPDGKTIIVGGYEPNLIFWNFETEEIIREVSEGRGIEDISISPDGNLILIAHEYSHEAKQYASIYNIAENKFTTLLEINGGINIVDFSPNGEYLAVASIITHGIGKHEGIITIFDGNTFEKLVEYSLHTLGLADLKFSPDSRYLVSCGEESKAFIITTANMAVVDTIENYITPTFWNLSYSRDSKYFVTGNGSQNAHRTTIWDIETGNNVYEYDYSGYKSVAVSPDNKYILSAHKYDLYLLNANWEPTAVTEDAGNWPVLYPNPSGKIINIEFAVEFSQDIEITISSGSGMQETILKDFYQPGTHNTRLDCSKYPNGAYFITLKAEQGSFTEKVIISK